MSEVLLLNASEVLPKEGDVRSETRQKDETYENLKAAIKRVGQLQPIGVVSIDGNGNYRTIFGETRRQICEELGIPVQAVELPEEALQRSELEVTLIENLARRDLSPMEEARAIQALQKAGGSKGKKLSGARVAKILCMSPAWVSERLKLLKLPEEVQQQVESGDITTTEAISAAYAQQHANDAGEDGDEAASTSASGSRTARTNNPGRGKTAPQKKVRPFGEIAAQLEGRYSLAKIKELEETSPEEFALRMGYRKGLLFCLPSYNAVRKHERELAKEKEKEQGAKHGKGKKKKKTTRKKRS